MVDLKDLPKMLRDAADALEKAMPHSSEPAKSVGLEKVRAVLVRKSAAGKREAVKALITKYGAERLSDIPDENYAAMREEAEAL